MNDLRKLSFALLIPVLIIFILMGIVWIFNTFEPIDIFSFILTFAILSGISCFILSFFIKEKKEAKSGLDVKGVKDE